MNVLTKFNPKVIEKDTSSPYICNNKYDIMITEIDDFCLRSLNTMRMNVSCAKYISFTEPEEAPEAWRLANAPNLKEPPAIIGGGSNILFTGNRNGAVIHPLINIWEATPLDGGKTEVTLGAAISLDDAAERTCAAMLWGLENLSGIPGTVGGATVQNAGAYGTDLSNSVIAVSAFDVETGTIVDIQAENLQYGYRTSMFKTAKKFRYIILTTTLSLSSIPKPILTYGPLKSLADDCRKLTPAAVRKAVLEIRSSKLPEDGSAGSYFKNPVVSESEWQQVIRRVALAGIDPDTMPTFDLGGGNRKLSAAWLIDRAGWKGRVLGEAATWHLQPLIIVNATGNASPDDILAIEGAVTDAVESKFGVRLSPEVVKI